jgi:membrane associated rhomboid family serine protease
VIPLKDDIPTRRFPVLTLAIIVICCVVYFGFEGGLWSLGQTGDERVVEYGAIPYEITHPGDECGFTADGSVRCEGQAEVGGAQAPEQAPWYLTVLTSMFMHGSLLHLGGNMLFLWIFGNNIEDSMGRPRFLIFYLLGGAAALALQVVTDPSSTIPTVGASGAIAAVLGAYAVLYPRARVVTLVFIIIIFTVIQLPALVVLGIWFVLQLLPAFSDPIGGGGGGVAYFAHIGGFLFGMLLIKLFADNVHEDYDTPRRLPVY